MTALKVAISVAVIVGSSSLAGTHTQLAGWIVALPVSSMLTLAFSQAEFGDTLKTASFARAIFLSIPLSLLFFVPFLFAHRLRWTFGALYGGGVTLLGVGYMLQRWLML